MAHGTCRQEEHTEGITDDAVVRAQVCLNGVRKVGSLLDVSLHTAVLASKDRLAIHDVLEHTGS